jgi:hypothetical protein
MAVVAQLLKEEDLLKLTSSDFDVLESIVYREIINNDEFKQHLTTRLQSTVTKIKKKQPRKE